MSIRNPHPLRAALHNEVHSRPCERMVAPLAVQFRLQTAIEGLSIAAIT